MLASTEPLGCFAHESTSLFQNTIMLSLGDEQWSDYYGQAPDSPVRNPYDEDDSESDGSCCSPEPRSPPGSPTRSAARGKLPEVPCLSPRSVEEENLDAQASSSSWMCIYDLDSLCIPGDSFSDTFSILDPSQMSGGEASQYRSGLLSQVVDLFSSYPQSEEEKKDDSEPHRDNHQPIQEFLLPLNAPAPSTHQKRRRFRSRKSRTKINCSNRCVLVESCWETIPEVNETEEIEAIYLRVRYPPPPHFFYVHISASHILFHFFSLF